MTVTEKIEGFVERPDGRRVFFAREGTGARPAVLLIHSLGTTHRLWDPQVPALDEVFDVLRLDLRGHGGSDVGDGPYDIAALGEDACAVLEACRVGSAHIVGLSMGGMVAQWLAAHRPERVERLVIANSAAFIPARELWDRNIAMALSEGMTALAEPTMRGWLSPSFPDRHVAAMQALVAGMEAMSPQGYADACRILRDTDLRDDLRRIAAPTLIINGEADGPRGRAAADGMSEGIGGSVRRELPGAGHLSNIDHPDAFTRLVRDFLTTTTTIMS
ncbi:MAG TPA: alpha/beta fold hydrolase [Sphingobium sp.]|nr:alpha/beta fold hydrolase [Sphingobium sp.]